MGGAWGTLWGDTHTHTHVPHLTAVTALRGRCPSFPHRSEEETGTGEVERPALAHTALS